MWPLDGIIVHQEKGRAELERTQLTRSPILTPIVSSLVPKTTFSFNNLIEELMELSESCYTYSYGFITGE